MYYYRSSPVLTNCEFEDNSAADGGGLADGGKCSPILTNCTFNGNSANKGGGAIAEGSGAAATVVNSILWDDSAPQGPEVFSDTEIALNDGIVYGQNAISVTYSDVAGGYQGVGNISTDPLFVTSAGGGGAIQPYSSCAGAGNVAAIEATGVTTDILGNPRITSGTVDIGAYQAISTLTAIAGGPYTVGFGGSVTLKGEGSSDLSGGLSFAW